MAADGDGSQRASVILSSHQSSGIRHNSCHAQISDIFSSSVAYVTLATPLREQMAQPTLLCALPNTNPVLAFFRAPGFFPRAEEAQD